MGGTIGEGALGGLFLRACGCVGERAAANTGLSERGSVGRVMKLVRKGRLEECWGRVFCSPSSVRREVSGGIERRRGMRRG